MDHDARKNRKRREKDVESKKMIGGWHAQNKAEAVSYTALLRIVENRKKNIWGKGHHGKTSPFYRHSMPFVSS